MTKKLYDFDGHLAKFEATVLSCEKTEKGWRATLDQTAFFPEGGGQKADTGSLGGANVFDVQIESGVIFHELDAPLTVGETVFGEIDYETRFRRMQNHSGEHIVSGLIHTLFGFENVGFHMGSECVTVDYSGELSEEQLARVEALANRAVWENREIRIEYPAPETLKTIPYRSKLDLKDDVRIVTIDGYDICACCAPHVSRTGEIGVIKLLEAIRYKGGTRLNMLCGFDALADYDEKYRVLRKISNRLSAKQNEAFEAVLRLEEEIAAQKNSLYFLKKSLIEAKIAAMEETAGSICLFEESLEADSMRRLANEGAQRCGGICIVLSGSDQKGYSFIAASRNVPLREEAKKIAAALCGKGGGSDEMIQGRISASRKEIEAYFGRTVQTTEKS